MQTQSDDLPVTLPQVRISCGPIAGFLDYLRFISTNDVARRTTVTADQIWAFYVEHIRNGAAPQEVAEDLGLPVSPEW